MKRERDGSCAVGVGTSRSSELESMGQNCVQTEPLRYTSHGRRGRGCGFSVCECKAGKVAGVLCHGVGTEMLFAKEQQSSCP